MAHTRQSRPDSGLGVLVKVCESFEVVFEVVIYEHVRQPDSLDPQPAGLIARFELELEPVFATVEPFNVELEPFYFEFGPFHAIQKNNSCRCGSHTRWIRSTWATRPLHPHIKIKSPFAACSFVLAFAGIR